MDILHQAGCREEIAAIVIFLIYIRIIILRLGAGCVDILVRQRPQGHCPLAGFQAGRLVDGDEPVPYPYFQVCQ